MDAVEILRKLVSFNTIKDKENREIIEWIAQYLDSLGFQNKKFVDSKTGKINLLSSIGDNPILTFSGHTDTVPASVGWTGSPFELIEVDGKLFGLGTCDMKGGIAAFLAAAAEIDKSRLERGINLLFTYDEEINFSGVIDFLKQGHKLSKYVIIPEPTEMKPISASKGCLGFRVKFKGKSVHSSDPDKGISAILSANEFINDLNVYTKELRRELNNVFSVPYATFNIGKISGGDAINKVPDECTIEFEFRTVYKEQTKQITDKVFELTKRFDCEINVELSIDAMNCGDFEFVKVVGNYANSKAESVNYVTEASLLQNSECSVVLLGPGPMNAHVVNEFVSKDDVLRLVEAFWGIISYYCY